MSAAAKGSETAIEAFKKIGVNSVDAAGNMRPLQDVFLDVADKFQSMPDGAEKSRLALELFGRQGLQLIPVLDQGREGVGKWMKVNQEFGAQLTEHDKKILAAYRTSITTLGVEYEGIKNKVTEVMLPALTALSNAFTGDKETARVMTKIIVTGVADVAEGLLWAVPSALKLSAGFAEFAGVAAQVA